MTMRSFLKLQELWRWKSESPHIKPGMRAYAHSRAKFYAQHAMKVLLSCREHLYVSLQKIKLNKPVFDLAINMTQDKTVELTWASNWLRDNVISMWKSLGIAVVY